jgi:hypothetical protein
MEATGIEKAVEEEDRSVERIRCVPTRFFTQFSSEAVTTSNAGSRI